MHVLQCTAVGAKTTWQSSLLTLTDTLHQLLTPPESVTALLSRLTAWHDNAAYDIDPTWSPPLQADIASQDIIGWKPFLEGLPSTSWRPYIMAYYTAHNIRKSPNRWLVKLLQAFHDHAWAMWEQRNEVIHLSHQLRQRVAEDLLDSLITHELTQGHLDLPPSDHHYFSQPLGHLLYQSVPYKQAWYENVLTAQERQDHHSHTQPLTNR